MLSLSFLRAHARLLGFGVLMTFCSSVGQTFFISLFSGEIRGAFGLSDGAFGSLYSLGTLASAAVLLGAGRLIDRVPLQAFAAGVLVLLAAVCLLMGLAGNAVVLVLALFGLRFFGQGLASHSAIVAMGRYFEATRGRAVSIATLGHTLGEATLPAVAVAALALAGWRQVWSGTAVVLLVLVLVPLVFLLLKGQRARDEAFRRQRDADSRDTARTADRTLGAALRDPGLWLRLPALLASPFIGTGLIFHQVHLSETKGWPLSLMAGSFTVYAACSLATLLLAGPLVDRFGARRLVPLALVPLVFGCLALASNDNPLVATLFMGLLGTTTGIGAVLKGRVVEASRKLAVLNADDPLCGGMADLKGPQRVCFFTLGGMTETLRAHVAAGGLAVTLEEEGGTETIVLHDGNRGGQRLSVIAAAAIPATLGGAARHNIQNAMAALGLALGLGLSPVRIAEALASFRSDHGDNPGRLNIYQGYPFTVVHDSAHNPHGMRAACAALRSLPVKGRRIAVISGVGFRHGEHIEEVAEIVAKAFDFYICSRREELRNLTEIRRDFPLEEVPQRIADALIARGVDPERIEVIDLDREAVDRGLALAREGDLLALLTGMVEWTWERMLTFGQRSAETGTEAGTETGTGA